MSKPGSLEIPSTLIAGSGDLPSHRCGHTAVVYKDMMFVYGGIDKSRQYDPKIYAYSFDENRWKVVPVSGFVPSGRTGHSAVVYGDSMYVFGGLEPDKKLSNGLYEFSFETRTWKEIKSAGEVPSPRFRHASVVYKEYMFVIGGSKDALKPSQLAKIFRYHFVSREWKWVSSLPKPVSEQSVISIDNYIYVFGGLGTGFAFLGGCTNKIQRYNIVGGDWGEIDSASAPSARKGHSAVVYNNWFYVFGGDGAIRHYNDLYAYNHSVSTWKRFSLKGREADIPQPRGGHSSVIYRGKMYVFGGDYGMAQKYFNDMFILELGPDIPFFSPETSLSRASSTMDMSQLSGSGISPTTIQSLGTQTLDGSDNKGVHFSISPPVERSSQPVPPLTPSSRRESTFQILNQRRQSLHMSLRVGDELEEIDALALDEKPEKTKTEGRQKKTINHKIMNETWLLQVFNKIFQSHDPESGIPEIELVERFKEITDLRWKKAFFDKHREIHTFLRRFPDSYRVEEHQDSFIIYCLLTSKQTDTGVTEASTMDNIASAAPNSQDVAPMEQEKLESEVGAATDPKDNQGPHVLDTSKLDDAVQDISQGSQAIEDNIEPLDVNIAEVLYDPLREEIVNIFVSIFEDNTHNHKMLVAELSSLFYNLTGSKWLSCYGQTYGTLVDFLTEHAPLFSVEKRETAGKIAIYHPEELEGWRNKMRQLKEEQEVMLEQEQNQRRQAEEQSKIQKKLEKRKHVIRELYQTEVTYVRNLHYVVEKHIESLLRQLANGGKPLAKEDLNTIYYLIESLYKLHQDSILVDLRRVAEDPSPDASVSAVFIKSQHFLKIYSSYADNYERAMDTYLRCIKLPPYAAFCKSCLKDPASQGLDLPSYLIQPVQRLPRYKLLLEELSKNTPDDHPDYEGLLTAIEVVKNLASNTNKQIKTANVREKIGKVDGFEKLFRPTRHYIGEASGILSDGSAKVPLGSATIVLFSDILIIILGRVIYSQIDINVLWVSEIESDESQLSLMIKSPEIAHTFSATLLDAKLQLLSHISELLSKLGLEANRTVEYKYASGTYTGEMLDGQKHGHGKMVVENVSEYEGTWLHDKRHGKGFFKRISSESTEFYDGEWENDKQNGRGTVIYPNGSKVIAFFEDGEPIGIVNEVIPDGRNYIGTWLDGKRSGQGTMTYPNGARYEGGWINNNRHGRGKYILECKEKDEVIESYEGEWKNDMHHGHGIHKWDYGTYEYKGNWVMGKKEGSGRMKYPNGDKYRGGWESDMRHGHGTYEDIEGGYLFEGTYVRGRKDGKGVIKKANGDQIIGQWVDGVLIGSVDYVFAPGSSWLNPSL
eukprot:TRINITY_DN851_c0_g1_i4.p1 TRINITY_DN851_c0_g1~~TRINITY_DN851_c0_g1_i4.p1  ORF type:complete len:1328 (-),score=243.35 TRINITY_DN851_c0_g1_i4:664-4647(-)